MKNDYPSKVAAQVFIFVWLTLFLVALVSVTLVFLLRAPSQKEQAFEAFWLQSQYAWKPIPFTFNIDLNQSLEGGDAGTRERRLLRHDAEAFKAEEL